MIQRGLMKIKKIEKIFHDDLKVWKKKSYIFRMSDSRRYDII